MRFALAACVLLAGCAVAEEPPDEVVPIGGWGDDDDATAQGPRSPHADFPPGFGQVPVDPDSEDFDFEPCHIVDLLGPDCTEVEHTPFKLDLEEDSCPLGDFVFEDAAAWTDFLRVDCAWEGDDIAADLDWSVSALRVHVGQGDGCGCSHDTMWLASCDDGHHLGYWFYPCGPCGETFTALTAAAVPADSLPVQLHQCVPYDVRCVN